jgi:hypothetical protein
MAYYSIEPFGQKMGFIQSGQICATLVNTHRDPKKPPVKMEDCILEFDQKEQSPEDIKNILMGLVKK